MEWQEYYAQRVENRESLSFFIDKYFLFLQKIRQIIDNTKDVVLIEEGCGIGGVAKALNCMGVKPTVIMRDNNSEMLKLCMQNNIFNVKAYQLIDIRSSKKMYPKNSVVVTHGVLEHFGNDDIDAILSTFDNENIIAHIHYVPTDQYTEKSFGDERLLPIGHWLTKIHPTSYCVTNSGKDAWFFKE